MTALVNSASRLTSYITDLPAPFDEGGKLDLYDFAALYERRTIAGAPAIVVGETAGEARPVFPARA